MKCMYIFLVSIQSVISSITHNSITWSSGLGGKVTSGNGFDVNPGDKLQFSSWLTSSHNMYYAEVTGAACPTNVGDFNSLISTEVNPATEFQLSGSYFTIGKTYCFACTKLGHYSTMRFHINVKLTSPPPSSPSAPPPPDTNYMVRVWVATGMDWFYLHSVATLGDSLTGGDMIFDIDNVPQTSDRYYLKWKDGTNLYRKVVDTIADCESSPSDGESIPRSGLVGDTGDMFRLDFTGLDNDKIYCYSSGWNSYFTVQFAATGAKKDPHLKLANGGRTDFRGTDKTLYNFVSSFGYNFNVKTEFVDFMLHKTLVHGSFMTEAHILTPSAQVSVWGFKIGERLTIWVNGTCDNTNFKQGVHVVRQCGDTKIETDYSNVKVTTQDWITTIRCNHVYNRLQGPKVRLDFNLQKLTTARSHGILGQSYYLPNFKNGREDVYPDEGEFTTSAMAEGVIEGSAHDYVVPSPYATSFKYSKYDQIGKEPVTPTNAIRIEAE